MTSKLEMPSYTADRLAEIFETYIPFNKLLGLRCLEINDGDVRTRCLARLGAPYSLASQQTAP